jgi:glycosyltransferase involved in cell wall biosynthesis
MRTAVIATTHNDYSGGGRYCLQLAQALSPFFDVSMAGFDSDRPALTGMSYAVKPYTGGFTPDLFIAASHHGAIPPRGKVNAHICYFPLDSAAPMARQYDLAISICEYADRYQKERWGLPSLVINPYIQMADYRVEAKENLLLNVGNYFFEADGHSKNQHLVIDWFLRSGLADRFALVCTGFVGNQAYFESLTRRAAQHPSVRVLQAVPFAQLSSLYARAKYLIHAIGYGRKLPHQTEHFGYVAVEAMASGCQPVVHDSGGCRDIEGVRTWRTPADIGGRLLPADPAGLRQQAARYSYDWVVEHQVEPFARRVTA